MHLLKLNIEHDAAYSRKKNDHVSSVMAKICFQRYAHYTFSQFFNEAKIASLQLFTHTTRQGGFYYFYLRVENF